MSQKWCDHGGAGHRKNGTEEQRELIDAILTSGKTVLRMVDRSLDLYKMEEGMYQIRRTNFDLADLMRNLNHRWITIRNAKQIHIRYLFDGTELTDYTSFQVYAEQQSIENLVANLVENALEAAPEESTITFQANRNERGFVLDVHNYGVIPESIREKFFDRYITHGKSHGTGLGTYSAYLITRAHGGTISFTTDEQEGTHLTVEIPS